MPRRKSRAEKAKTPCQGCGECIPGKMERHHLIPRRDPRFFEHRKEYKRALTIILCTNCHKLVHDTFGPGDKFIGPITRKHLVRWLQTEQSN